MKFTVISDTHNKHSSLDLGSGDVLLHCGDFSGRGTSQQIIHFNEWINQQDFKYKVVIAGNHDFMFENDPEAAQKLLTDVIYLQDSFIEIEGIKIYGSPWQPWFFDWAFNLKRGKELADKWAMIPEDTDILLTHGPPSGIGDITSRGDHAGCEDLLVRVKQIKPKFHCFGHIHEHSGQWQIDDTTYINASICDLAYNPTNPYFTFEL
ncbi:MAG: metallophosphatase domain-containing protein [Lentisphaeraceae bacterium]|nr:metallophosphatase domain-containing protein [Lentisphaeraceae bacterium]